MKSMEALNQFFADLSNKEVLAFKREDPEGLRELCVLSAEALGVELIFSTTA